MAGKKFQQNFYSKNNMIDSYTFLLKGCSFWRCFYFSIFSFTCCNFSRTVLKNLWKHLILTDFKISLVIITKNCDQKER